MKLFALFVAAFLFGAASAFGQTTSVDPCTGAVLNQPPTPPLDLTQPLVCERDTGRTYDFNKFGAIAWRYCYSPTLKKYRSEMVVAPWDDLKNVPGMAKDVASAGLSADNETIRQMLIKYKSGHIADAAHAAVWCPFKERMLAGVPPPPPPVPVVSWVTASTITYKFTGSALAGVSGTVKLNEACDCSKPYVFGTATYCPVKGAAIANVVARCKSV